VASDGGDLTMWRHILKPGTMDARSTAERQLAAHFTSSGDA